jgi:phage tail-like protein
VTELGFRYLNLLGEWPSFALTGLTIDAEGQLTLESGAHGSFLGGPFEIYPGLTRWHTLRVLTGSLPPETRLRLFTYTSDVPDPPVWDATGIDLNAEPTLELTGPGEWRAAPGDAVDLLIHHQPARYLWLAGTVDGNGTTAPVIRQIQVTFNHESYLRHLPAIYRDGPPATFLTRVLDLVENLLGEPEQAISDLPALFDPWATPDQPNSAGGTWLDWLSGWVAFPLDEAWDTGKRRSALADAFAWHARRGTIEGLRQAIALYAGATAHIEEPAANAAVWSLGSTSALGFTTMLAAAQPAGAVLDRTAVLDHSHLIFDAQAGAPLFADLAHRFCVQVYQRDAPTVEAVAKIRSVIDREKPAHTTYDLCVVGANLRVGQQARLGIDAFVGGPPPDRVPSAERRLGVNSVLPASADHREERVGHISVRNDTRFEDKETMR